MATRRHSRLHSLIPGLRIGPGKQYIFESFVPYWRGMGYYSTKSCTVKERTFQRKHTRESSILEQVPLHAMYLELVLSTEHAFNYDQTMNSRARMLSYGEHASLKNYPVRNQAG